MAKSQVKFWRIPALDQLEVLRGQGICHSFGRHLHGEFGLGVVEQGQLAYQTRTAETVLLPGEIVVINPGQVHWGGAVEARCYSYRIIYPSAALMARAMGDETGISQAEGAGFPYFLNGKVCDRNLAARLLHLTTVLEHDPMTLVQESYLVAVLSDLMTRHGTLTHRFSHSPSVQRVRDYIQAFYAQNLSLSELAALVEMKPLRLLRSFRKEIGLPPHAYLLQVRIEQAKRQLLAGDAIATVALDTGFADQSHFTRHFKRSVGVTPGQYGR
ncbi:MAG: AraC family transcriptional regulator [Cyanobacteria bacterium P01_A01_bin.105]